MSNHLQKLVSLTQDKLRDFVTSEASDDELETMFGEEASAVKLYAEVEGEGDTAGDSLIVLLPGLMGSVLKDAASDTVIWVNPVAFIQGRVNDLNLNPDGLTNVNGGVNIIAPNPLWAAYAKIVLRLRYNHQVVTYPFDWRVSTEESARRMMAFIDEQLASSPYEKATLIGHSLGGVVTIDYLCSADTKAHAEANCVRAIALARPSKGR